jgi:predicted aconitase with swiveling domain
MTRLGNTVIRCVPVVRGVSQGEALVTNQPMCLYDSLNPKTGRIVNRRHELYGECVSGKILFFPCGIGSSTSAATLLEASRCKRAPGAIINLETEPIIAVGALLAEKLYGNVIPIVHRPEINPAEIIKFHMVRVNADKGLIEVLEQVKQTGGIETNEA